MKQVQLGLKENWKQFTLLVIINAFVGGMVGLERSILPRIADITFHIALKRDSFIHHCIWNCKSNYQLLHRYISKQVWKKKIISSWLDNWHSNSIHFNVCSFMELDNSSKRTFRNQPGPNLVEYNSNEDRSCR
jgi:hypothetical protein